MAQTKHILILIQRTVSSIEYYPFEGDSLDPLYTAYAQKHPAPSNQTLGDFFSYNVGVLECENEGIANEYIRDIRDKVIVVDELEELLDSFSPSESLLEPDKKEVVSDK